VKGPGLLSSLRHRDFALLMGSFTTSSTGAWAYNVALAVWLLDETGSAGWVAASTVVRFVPALMMSAYGGVIAERFERVRLMTSLDLVFATVMAAIAVEMALGAPPLLVVLTAGVSSTLSSIYEPAAAAMTPQLVPERDLGSANALRNTIDNITVIAGPALGALILLVADEWVALLVNAGTFLVSAALVSAIRARSTPVGVTEGGDAGPVQQMLVGIRTIADTPSTATLVAFSIIATMVFGIDTVLLVVLSEEVLGTGSEGFGYLLAGLGVGGILAAGVVTRLERLPRLGTVILLGIAAYCLPTLLFLVVDSPVVGFLIQCLRGAATLVVDVLAITALQRSVPSERLARVFGAFDSLMILAVLAGSSVVPLLLELVGLDGAIVFAGLVVPLLCLLGLPWLRRMDADSVARRAELAPRIALLERCLLFADVRSGAVEQLAGSATFVDVEEGTVVVREGEAADAFYVVDSGTYAATASGSDRVLSTMGPGTYFGEIGLIEAIPRTATVTASEGGRLLQVEGQDFVEALTQDTPSPALLDGAALRLSRTHPTRTLTRAALDSTDD
jgi:MFS family permease